MKRPESRVLLCLCHMSGREQEFIDKAFADNWVVPLGPNVTGFEEDLEKYMGDSACVAALSSGTAAIHLGLVMLGVTPGDEVICQSLTFAASANPITYLGANPIFVDSEPQTWNISPVLLEEAIKDRISKTGRKPKAIIAVDLYGMPADWERITEVAGRYEIPVLEDAAEGLGSEYKGHKCGTFGELGTLSFNGNKMITTSGGGALVCHTKEEKDKCIYLATQAREPLPYYHHTTIGYNYRLSNICAGIGRGQMTILNEHLEHHRHVHALYAEKLSAIPGIKLLSNPSPDFNSNYWLCNILIDSNMTGFTPEDLRQELDKANVESRPVWKPMHLQPVFASAPAYTDGTSERIFESGLCIPAGPWVGDAEVQYIVDTILSLYQKRHAHV